MRRTAVACLFALFIVLIDCSSETSRPGSVAPQPAPREPYVIPAEFLLKPVAERGLEGEIYISGTTNFPDGMKMWVVLGPKKAQQDAFVRGGRFRSGPLYQGVPVPITGSQPLQISAYFNGTWQNEAVLAALGDGGKNLQGELFKKTDPDVIDSDKILDAKFTLALPAVAPETNAINIVKHAVLTVPGGGLQPTSKKTSSCSHNRGQASDPRRDGAQRQWERTSTAALMILLTVVRGRSKQFGL